MTDTIIRPTPAVRGRSRAQRSVVLAGVLSAIGAAGLGLLSCVSIVVLGWATDPHSSGTSAGLVRAAGHLWLLAHRAPLTVHGDTVVLAPLGLTLLLIAFHARAAAQAARHSQARRPRELAAAAPWVLPPYLLIVAVVAAATRTAGVRAAIGPAALNAAVVVIAGVLCGLVRSIGARELTRGWPAAARGVASATVGGVAVLMATGAVLAMVALAVDGAQATALARSVQAAAPAGLALLVVQILLTPNAVVWAGAYAAGPGFAVGVGTHVAPAGVSIGSVPGLPLLAALPAAGTPPAASAVAALGVLAAGAVAGVLLARHCRRTPHQGAVWMVAAAVAIGAAFALLCWFAGGSGPGRLAILGPAPLVSGAAVAQWVALSGVPVAWVTSWRLRARATTAGVMHD